MPRTLTTKEIADLVREYGFWYMIYEGLWPEEIEDGELADMVKQFRELVEKMADRLGVTTGLILDEIDPDRREYPWDEPETKNDRLEAIHAKVDWLYRWLRGFERGFLGR